MSGVRVTSSTQRVIVESPSSVSVVNAGPVGPKGDAGTGTASSTISGEILVANTLWMMPHNLDLNSELDLNPAVWWFEDENGTPMEPISVNYVNSNIASAGWLEPVRGRWRLS